MWKDGVGPEIQGIFLEQSVIYAFLHIGCIRECGIGLHALPECFVRFQFGINKNHQGDKHEKWDVFVLQCVRGVSRAGFGLAGLHLGRWPIFRIFRRRLLLSVFPIFLLLPLGGNAAVYSAYFLNGGTCSGWCSNCVSYVNSFTSCPVGTTQRDWYFTFAPYINWLSDFRD
jgi:hypothetical protein